MNFVAREMELALLDDLYKRSIGKTSLINHWAEGIDGRYLCGGATQASKINQLRNFSQTLWQFINPNSRIDPTFSYSTWEAAFTEVSRLAAEERIVLILDEFTYVMQANPEVPSILQHAWDHLLKQSNVFLILSGSLAGVIQRTALDYQSPLYGRATARLKVQQLPFGALAEMLPEYEPDKRVAVYAITGGVPAYIEQFDDSLNIVQNLQQRIVSPTNVMLNDAPFLLHEQLDEPRNYMSIMETIGAGFHNLTDIAKMAGVPRSNLSKYLSLLAELGYIERQVPATVRRPAQSRQGRYVIIDPYLRFYFRFLAPNLSSIERGRSRQTISLLSDHLPDFIGTHTFEELCREWVSVRAEMNELPFLPERVGSFWSKQAQVDVLAINRRWDARSFILFLIRLRRCYPKVSNGRSTMPSFLVMALLSLLRTRRRVRVRCWLLCRRLRWIFGAGWLCMRDEGFRAARL